MTFPLVASVDQNSGESLSAAWIRTLGYGYNGVVYYRPLGIIVSWDGNLTALAAALPTYELHFQLTCKTHNDAGLLAVITNLPNSWRAGFRYNIYQEPEDNLTTSGQWSAYRAAYTSAANVIRAYNTANPTKTVSLPWLELHEYPGAWDLANFIPPTGDFAGILWSFFEYGENISMTRLQDKVDRVATNMSTYAPTKPWELMASAYTLENPPFTSTQRNNQALWLTESHDRLIAAGCEGWAWYNVNFPGTGGASGEGRVEQVPETLAALAALPDADIDYTDPPPIDPGAGGGIGSSGSLPGADDLIAEDTATGASGEVCVSFTPEAGATYYIQRGVNEKTVTVEASALTTETTYVATVPGSPTFYLPVPVVP